MLYDSSQYPRGQRELKAPVAQDARIVYLAGLIAAPFKARGNAKGDSTNAEILFQQSAPCDLKGVENIARIRLYLIMDNLRQVHCS